MTHPLPQPFTRADLEQGPLKRLSEGRWANAVLYRFEHRGTSWVVKDFVSRSFAVRNLIGRVLVRREVSGLKRVDGIAGAPSSAFRIDAHALAYRFVRGTSLRFTAKSAIGAEYFPELELDLREMHARARLVHLDLRNAHNILVGDDGTPSLLDFQSWLGTRWMPPPLRRFVESIDLAAIYKHWVKRSPDTMGPDRTAALASMNRLRPIWVLRGYIGEERPPGKQRD
jgi:RIO-like serine/threonine protein kinase